MHFSETTVVTCLIHGYIRRSGQFKLEVSVQEGELCFPLSFDCASISVILWRSWQFLRIVVTEGMHWPYRLTRHKGVSNSRSSIFAFSNLDDYACILVRQQYNAKYIPLWFTALERKHLWNICWTGAHWPDLRIKPRINHVTAASLKMHA